MKCKEIQEWFGKILTQPLGGTIPKKVVRRPERMEIYNQQYWYRLLTCMQETFPLLVRLFGYHEFNEQIATPYLRACPPQSWSLNDLNDRLLEWWPLAEPIARLAAEIDLAYDRAFVAGTLPPLEGDPDAVFHQPVFLQPHLNLIAADRDLLPFREEFLAHSVEYWLEHNFPKIPHRQVWYAIFRTKTNTVAWKELSKAEYETLNSLDGRAFAEVVGDENLPFWIQEWVIRNWVGAKRR